MGVKKMSMLYIWVESRKKTKTNKSYQQEHPISYESTE